MANRGQSSLGYPKVALAMGIAWGVLQATAATAAAQPTPTPSGDASNAEAPDSSPNQAQRTSDLAPASALSAPEQDSLEERRRVLQLRLLEREYRQYRLTGPVALMAIGGGIASLGLVAGAFATACESDGDSDEECSGGVRTGFIAFAIAGAAVVVAGIVWLITLVSERAPLKTRIERMRREAPPSRPRASIDFVPTLGGARLRLAF